MARETPILTAVDVPRFLSPDHLACYELAWVGPRVTKSLWTLVMRPSPLVVVGWQSGDPYDRDRAVRITQQRADDICGGYVLLLDDLESQQSLWKAFFGGVPMGTDPDKIEADVVTQAKKIASRMSRADRARGQFTYAGLEIPSYWEEKV